MNGIEMLIGYTNASTQQVLAVDGASEYAYRELGEGDTPLVLAAAPVRRRERDVRHQLGKARRSGRVEVREHIDPADLLRRHHECVPPA